MRQNRVEDAHLSSISTEMAFKINRMKKTTRELCKEEKVPKGQVLG
jgi:hypothetical protein